MKGTKTQKTPKELKAWEKEKKLIPVMIKKYCHGKHGTKGEELCEEWKRGKGESKCLIGNS